MISLFEEAPAVFGELINREAAALVPMLSLIEPRNQAQPAFPASFCMLSHLNNDLTLLL